MCLHQRESWERAEILERWQGYVNFTTVFLKVVIKRKSKYWDVRTYKSIFWNVVNVTRDCLRQNDAEYCISDCWTLSWQNWMKICGPRWKPTSASLQAFNWVKNNLAKMHKSQVLGWAFTSLSCYSVFVKTIRGVYKGGINFIAKTLPLTKS